MAPVPTPLELESPLTPDPPAPPTPLAPKLVVPCWYLDGVDCPVKVLDPPIWLYPPCLNPLVVTPLAPPDTPDPLTDPALDWSIVPGCLTPDAENPD